VERGLKIFVACKDFIERCTHARISNSLHAFRAYLHSRKLIHRDLKPQNLLITQDWVCKVTDFGVSTVYGTSARTMTSIGTPVYMAPEGLCALFVQFLSVTVIGNEKCDG
jgi:serine/threonine protein kinase